MVTLQQLFTTLRRWRRRVRLFALAGAAGLLVLPATAAPPRIWVFAGNPGDEEHHEVFENLLGRLSQALTTRYGIPRANLTVLYRPESAGYHGVCSRENLLAELGRIRESAARGDQGPVWIVLMGHANKVRGGTRFNLPGPDISLRELGRELAKLPDNTPLVLWATTTATYSILREAAAPNRAVISASSRNDPENETEFPNAFVAALEDAATDANEDGKVTVPELFSATRAGVLKIYEEGDFVVKEQALLDGDGDGKGTSRPSRADSRGAEQFYLKVNAPNSDFD